MFLRNFVQYSTMPWTPWGGAFNSAAFATGLWLSVAILTVVTSALALSWHRIPARINIIDGRDWLYFALWIPILFACDLYVERIVQQYKDGVGSDDYVHFSEPRERIFWWFHLASLIAMVLVMLFALETRN